MRRKGCAAALLTLLTAAAGGGDDPVGSRPATRPADDLEYWLARARPATRPATTQTAPEDGVNPFAKGPAAFRRADAVPGVIELSDGGRIAGGVHGTREEPYRVWVEKDKRWQRIPLIAALSITAVVVEERMELQWHWKETGLPEKVYTGRKYPWRRFLWTFRLIDGSTVTGAVKGQPIWAERPAGPRGPWVLAERSKGTVGSTLKDLVYVKRVILSRKMMEKVQAEQRKRAARRGS